MFQKIKLGNFFPAYQAGKKLKKGISKNSGAYFYYFIREGFLSNLNPM